MEALLVFNHINDIIYAKCSEKFVLQMTSLGQSQGFFDEQPCNDDKSIPDDVLVQIFSPIITSQRIMACQFGNSYTSIQCDDGTNICFDEYMGYLIICVSTEDVQDVKKTLAISINLMKHLCGPDVSQLKMSEDRATLLSSLIDSWRELKDKEQSFQVEALEKLIVNGELGSLILEVSRKSVEKLRSSTEYKKIHLLILVRNKFLSLYSSQNASELQPSDILFLTIMANVQKGSFQVMLSDCLIHIVHIMEMEAGLCLIYLFEVGTTATASSLNDSFVHLHLMQLVQIQRDPDSIRPVFSQLDNSVKKLLESLRKSRNSNINKCTKELRQKWTLAHKKYEEFLGNLSDEALLRGSTHTLNVLDSLNELLGFLNVDNTVLFNTKEQTGQVAQFVIDKLSSYGEFFQVKADFKNFSLGSRDSLTKINKYLDEFPGLVHFLYVDRNNHRVTTPNLDNGDDNLEAYDIMKNNVWSMIKCSWTYLQSGTMSMMWKDKLFNYGYFLWFEDSSGAALKPLVFPINSNKVLPLPGLIADDFYRQLKNVCFPKMPPSKIRCYEIYSIHLGLVNAALVLEHVRRLSATVWELCGLHPVDLL